MADLLKQAPHEGGPHAARDYLGTSYSWGGGGDRGPGYGIDLDANVVGFDCSGLTQYAYYQAGILLPRNSRAQYTAYPKVARADLQPGDLVFFYTPVSHVGIYIGNGQMVHASVTGRPVAVTSVDKGGYVGARRVTG